MSASIVVSVRVRPFNAREIKYQSRLVVRMPSPGLTEIISVKNGKFVDEPPKKFNFDHCLWTHDPESPDFATQEIAYQCLGKNILDNSLAGFNSCLFAYGQTGSGKTYTMMGSPTDPGVIPRLCADLFERADAMKDTHQLRVECSYLEIYNEQVRDLLNPAGMDQTLRVRQHPKLGVFVEGLKRITTRDKNEIDKLIADGAKIRSVAATNMNASSSRSHAIITLNIYVRGPDSELSSQLHLVDLAGSERATSTGATGDTLTEGANINKSLTTLGMCLSRLAEVAASDGKNKGHIPYRDSQLTWLLHDSLGGNSKTAMLANISPADINYEETLSTLRFAATTKKIKTNAVINEDPQQKLIRELREEIAELKLILTQREAGIVPTPMPSLAEGQAGGEGEEGGDGSRQPSAEPLDENPTLGENLRESSIHMATSDLVDGLTGLTEKMIELIRTDEEVAQDDEAARIEYEKQMQAFDEQFGAVFLDNSVPRLTLLNEDVVGLVTAASALQKDQPDACCDVELAYYFKEMSTDIGCSESCGIRLPRSSAAMREIMATVTRDGADSYGLTITKNSNDPTLTDVYVNGRPLGDHPEELRHLDRLIVGPFVFRVAIPATANNDDDDQPFNGEATSLHHLALLEEYTRLAIHVEQAVAANGVLEDLRVAAYSLDANANPLDDDANISETSPRFTEMNAGIDVEDVRYRMAAVENELISSYPPLVAGKQADVEAAAMKYDYKFAVTERNEHAAALATLHKLAEMKRKEAENDLEIERLKIELARKATERVAKQMAAEEEAQRLREEQEKQQQQQQPNEAPQPAVEGETPKKTSASDATKSDNATPDAARHVDPTATPPAAAAAATAGGASAKDRWKKAVRKVSAVQSFMSPNPASRVAAAAEEKLLLAFELQQHEETCRIAQAWQPNGPVNPEHQKEYQTTLTAPQLGAFRESARPVFEGTVQKLRVKTGFFSRSGYHPVFLVVLPRRLAYFEKTAPTCPARGCVFYYGASIRACGLQSGKYAFRIDPSVPRKQGKAGNDNSVTLAVDTAADCEALVLLLQRFSLPEPTPRVAAFLEAQAAEEALAASRPARAETVRERDSIE